ncbi:hypothetical protein CPB84DRAFT_1796937 [Gymnopilus junonius]|uniref:FAD/NAD(P)-binding domain-containing protein n=1 Tax=Gymnopilus junonius TaxID=109634 RepID=A0A9P5NC65_GYMJU|nr:hypothetical protein CPB84DRAFT_1796937 [Gymnopilus junonius]
MAAEPQNIVIVGGGCAGLSVFNALHAKLSKVSSSTKTSLTLITSRPFFTHIPALLRTAVTSEGHLEERILIPLTAERFTQGNNKLIVASVVNVVDDSVQGQHHVVLDNGETVSFSVLVLAPGSIWEGPIDLPNTKAEVIEKFQSWRDRFAKAKDVVLVGGGSIGAELAGEIKDLDSNKNVTIVHSNALLFNESYPDRWRNKGAQTFRDRGINFVLDDYVDDIEIKDGNVHTRSGKSIKADLIIPTRGPRPNTSFFSSLDNGDALTKAGYVKVLPTLQLVNHPRIFAAGDVIEWNEQKQAGKVTGHASVVVNNILVLLGQAKALQQYKSGPELIVVTNGKNGGTGYAGVLWGIILGNWLCKVIKSKTLLISIVKSTLQL